MSEIIATSQIDCIRKSGSRFSVTIEVRRPYQIKMGEWACSISILGLHDGLRDVRGEDSLQALCLALTLAWQLLKHFIEDGGRIVNVGTNQNYPIDAIFSAIGNAKGQ